MVDHTTLQLTLAAKLLTLSVATTGSVTLSTTANGYARTAVAGVGTVSAAAGVATFSTSQAGVLVNGSIVTVAGNTYTVSAFNGTTGCTLSGAPTFGASAFTWTGSFYADGFWPGMELLSAGFATNGTRVITNVTPTLVTVSGTIPVESASPGRTLTVGLPSNRAWENVLYTPVTGVPYVEEQYLPGPAGMETDGYAGMLELLPMYSPRIYVPSGTGINADGRYADAIARLFMPGTLMPLPSGEMLTVRGDVAPFRGQRFPGATPGWSCVPITIPLRVLTVAFPS